MNIVGLGARVTVVGFDGEDEHSAVLDRCFADAGVQAKLTKVQGQPTTSKLRIFGGQHQMLRLDCEPGYAHAAGAYADLKAKVFSALCNVNAVVLSDHAKGVVTDGVCRLVIDEAQRKRIPIIVDPKHQDFSRYIGATTICTGLPDLSSATGISRKEVEAMLAAATAMLPSLGVEFLTVMLGDRGIAVLRAEGKSVYPAVSQQVSDTSGADDTVVATLAVALATGFPIEDAVLLANRAAGIVVSRVGAVPIRRSELLNSLRPEARPTSDKILSLDCLVSRVNTWRSCGERIVLADGCFDVLHGGHITLIENASRLGDRLVVAISSDASVQKLKGPTRPLVCEQRRGRILGALAAVDAVVIFREPTPIKVIEAILPDVIVRGGDYTKDTVIGAKEVRTWDGSVVIIPREQALRQHIIPQAPVSSAG